MPSEIASVDIYRTKDTTIKAFDYTTLSAINQCPTWGVLRYVHHKTMKNSGRSMALEAGGAAHEVFAAHRLYSLNEFGSSFYDRGSDEIDHICRRVGRNLFGEERYGKMVAAVNPGEDFRTRCQQFSLSALYSSGFYDDPNDRRRTITNLEEMCLAYMDKYDWSTQLPVVDGDFVGIEIPIDVTIEFTLVNGDHKVYRFIGRADGVHYRDKGRTEIRIHENKTASRLNDAWELSFETSHQVTGYMIGISCLTGYEITQAIILGSALPMPKSYAFGGLNRVVVNRYPFQFDEWMDWFWHTTQIYEQYKDDPVHAPKYTISCNRYFSPCMMIPYCATPPEDRHLVYDQMSEDHWSPLHDKYTTPQDE